MGRTMALVRRAVGTETSADLAAQIAALQAERLEALREVERLETERLTTAETFEQAADFERQAAGAKWKAERAATQLPELEQRLVDAKMRERHALIVHYLAVRAKLFNRLREALVTAAAIQTEAIAHDQLACRELGESLARAKLPAIPFRGILLAEHVTEWARQVAKALLAAEPKPERRRKVGPALTGPSQLTHPVLLVGGVPQNMVGGTGGRFGTAPAKPAAKPPAPAGLQHAVTLDPGIAASPGPRAKIIHDDAPLEAGQARVTVLRAGFEWNGRSCRPGDTIRMPIEQARTGALNGALDILEPRDLLTVGAGKT